MITAYWDPKITTLPGTYVLATISVNKIVAPIFSDSEASTCGTVYLRAYNQALLLVCGLLVYISERRKGDHNQATWKALSVMCLPWLFFYSQLFYTDTTGVAFLLLCRYFMQRSSQISEYNERSSVWFSVLATLSGAYAVFCRQINVLWVGMIATQSLYADLQEIRLNKTKNKYGSPAYSRRYAKVLVAKYLPHCGLGLSFAAFVCSNGGVAVGDHSNHQPALHLAQVFYLALFVCVPLSVCYLVSLMTEINSKRKTRWGFRWTSIIVLLATLTLLLAGALKYFVIAHPFLLADNRHYSFYFFQRFVLSRKWVLFMSTPMAAGALLLTLWKFQGKLPTDLGLFSQEILEFTA